MVRVKWADRDPLPALYRLPVVGTMFRWLRLARDPLGPSAPCCQGLQHRGEGTLCYGRIPTGEVVLRLNGRLVSTEELGRPIEHAKADPSHSYADTLTIYEDAHLVLPLGTAIYFGNHSCDPSMWHVGPYEIATRPAVGVAEELTIDYGTQSGAAGFSMSCSCGSPICRVVVSSSHSRLPELQPRYRHHWVPALESRIGAR